MVKHGDLIDRPIDHTSLHAHDIGNVTAILSLDAGHIPFPCLLTRRVGLELTVRHGEVHIIYSRIDLAMTVLCRAQRSP